MDGQVTPGIKGKAKKWRLDVRSPSFESPKVSAYLVSPAWHWLQEPENWSNPSLRLEGQSQAAALL